MILFSIVIPTYNRAEFIKTTINSVLEQTYFNFELIVVDDGSTDGTQEIIENYLADIRIQYFKVNNRERGAARNFGTLKSKGDYITFLDSDDIFLPWHLQSAAKFIELDKQPEAFHQTYEVMESGGVAHTPPLLPSPVNDKLIEGNFLSCMGVFLRRDIALKNLFDETRELSGSEDYELWLRVAAQVPVLIHNKVTSRLIQHQQRSMMDQDVEKLLTRIRLLEDKLLENSLFLVRYGNHLHQWNAYNALYLALHLVMAGERLLAVRKLLLCVKKFPPVVISYRFLVVIKKLIFS